MRVSECSISLSGTFYCTSVAIGKRRRSANLERGVIMIENLFGFCCVPVEMVCYCQTDPVLPLAWAQLQDGVARIDEVFEESELGL